MTCANWSVSRASSKNTKAPMTTVCGMYVTVSCTGTFRLCCCSARGCPPPNEIEKENEKGENDAYMLVDEDPNEAA